ncbi:tRNA preQ1(34) S-adenosylmethionine ribosyltransferase-isomerase QueA [Desulfuromonas sp. AOP6]|uniref:tRNA preQ1(34) S-adenosylmethionine ribosyltransferase-isomerase QueA n=1 Tax=Desulfuromonas sp. AOP6 TaxID=1566351 RepID=UPI0012DFC6F6
MRLEDFDFELPAELIAQYPLDSREGSRLMVLNRLHRDIHCGNFPDIVGHFHAGDVLVLNDTQVIPARLLGTKASGGKIEVFLVRRLDSNQEDWVCLTKSSKTPKVGSRLLLGNEIEGTVLGEGEAPYKVIRFKFAGDFHQLLEKVGRIPLPPYIRREDTLVDRERYQTVFACSKGAVAAPTAGLHFTQDILAALQSKGVEIVSLTLHVGLGTFLPVRVDNILDHRMHGESFHIPETTANIVNLAKKEGRRVVALGTTTTRTLEYALAGENSVKAGEGLSDLFIYPGFRFKIVDALITNFHLPCSTLMMLVSAFAGRDFIFEAYQRAIDERFRFFSYGDCMMIV